MDNVNAVQANCVIEVYEYLNGLEGDTSDNPQNENPKSKRGKEKLEYIENAAQRKVTLSRRKSTLFKNAFKLHVMTKASVLLIVHPKNQHRIVWGSPGLLKDYENGMLKPTIGQKFVSPEETDEYNADAAECAGPTVDPLTVTPEQMVDMSPSLANVLGHMPDLRQSPATHALDTLHTQNIPGPVREVLGRKPRARLYFDEVASTINEQTEITFVPDDIITSTNY